MSDLPIEIHAEIIRNAPWELFCAFLFASKLHYALCKKIDLRKFIRQTRNNHGEMYDILPNGVLHGAYNRIIYYEIYICQVTTTFYLGRLHGIYCMKVYDARNNRHDCIAHLVIRFINGHECGIKAYPANILKQKSTGLTPEDALKLSPAYPIKKHI